MVGLIVLTPILVIAIVSFDLWIALHLVDFSLLTVPWA